MQTKDSRRNLTEIQAWNKAAILEQLWNLAKKEDKLWIAWIPNYYLKGRKPWEVQVKQSSWIVKKIIQAGQMARRRGIAKRRDSGS